MIWLARVGVRRVQNALSEWLPFVPILAGVAVLAPTGPSGDGSMAFYAVAATVIPTCLVAIAVSGHLLAPRLHNGVDLFRAAAGLYLIGQGEFIAFRALYRDAGAPEDVRAVAAGVTAAFATVLVAALLTESDTDRC